MIEAENMNKKVRFFHSIHFKIALVFALLLLITFQIVGAIFKIFQTTSGIVYLC